MSNSNLVSYTKILNHKNSPRNNTIKKITIHHMAGTLSLETCWNVLNNGGISANYAIDNNGKIGLFVDEGDRAWTSASPDNDHQAITIEVANNSGAPNWTVSTKAFNSLIDLCVDICKRNGIKSLNYTGTTAGNLTIHKMFIDTECPGPYLESRMPEIARLVNERLGNSTEQPSTPQPSGRKYKVGQKVRFSTCYKASTDPIENHIKASNMVRDTGTITKIVDARNPYLLDNGLCWVNDGDIREVLSSTSNKKSIDVIAREVIAGNWDNGDDRKNRLKQAGYNPDAVQDKVNEIIYG